MKYTKQERIQGIVLICIVVFMIFPAVMGATMLRYRYDVRNAADTLLMCYMNSDTEWAKGFSEAKFDKVAPGMGKDEVRKIVGEPLATWDGTFVYSDRSPGTHGSYHIRQVAFKEDKVVSKARRFYAD